MKKKSQIKFFFKKLQILEISIVSMAFKAWNLFSLQRVIYGL